MNLPNRLGHWINNKEYYPNNGNFFDKYDPVTGEVIFSVASGSKLEIEMATKIAVDNFFSWSGTSIVRRAEIIRRAAIIMEVKKEEIAKIVSLETGKSLKDALGEVIGAIEMGFFIAGEGRRNYGKTTTSAVVNRTALTVRQPIGVCGLIIAANTPVANVAWKVYPALLCGNTVILKPSENTPYTAMWFAKILQESGLPAGVLSVINGLGEEAGVSLVNDPRIDLISFTGSVAVGKYIQRTTAERLTKLCLELGGKNALIICNDADLEAAAAAAVLSAFSNAGQRCAAASRIIIFSSVYEEFKKIFIKKVKKLTLGNKDEDDLGPVISGKQLNKLQERIREAVDQNNAKIILGGERLLDEAHRSGYYLEPTVIEDVSPAAAISQEELFGPVTCLYKVNDFSEALNLNNNTRFGLTAAIFTSSLHRSQQFQNLSRTGVVSVNGPTYGSEPHLPFGGLKNSGNGWREAGTEVLDVYSDWKTIYIKHDIEQI